MRRLIELLPLLALGIAGLVVAAAALAPSAAAQAGGASAAEPAPLGTWLDEEGEAEITVRRCGEGELCGRITWLAPDAGGHTGEHLDVNNPEPDKRDRPLLGLQILEGVSATPEKGRYRGGEIYDPETGNTYSCYLEPQEDGRLKLRGYVGFSLLGRTTYWRPVEEPRGLLAEDGQDETEAHEAPQHSGAGGRAAGGSAP